MAVASAFRLKEHAFHFTAMPYLMSSLSLAPAVYPHCYTCTERKCGEATGFTAQYFGKHLQCPEAGLLVFGRSR